MIDFLIRGGPIMVPIALCSVIGLALFLERMFALRISNVAPPEIRAELLELSRQRRWSDGLTLCRKHNNPLCRVLEVVFLKVGRRREEIKEVIEEIGRREVAGLEKFSGAIGVVAAVAPLLGLLGTVLGMIQTFDVIESQGMGAISGLAGGISQALITTFTGLCVGIPALVAHRYVLSRVDALSLEMEEVATLVLDLVEVEAQ